MGSFTPGKIFIEELWVSGTMTGRHSLQGIPGKEWGLNTGLPNPIIYIGLVVLCVMLSMRSSLRTHLQKQLSELWQQPEAPHHATSWDILGSCEEMEGRLWWLIT